MNETEHQSVVQTLRDALRIEPAIIGRAIRPFGSYAVVRLFEDQTETLGGIALAPQSAAKPQMVAEIIAVGVGQRSAYSGERLAPEFQAGDIVLLAPYSRLETTIWNHQVSHMVAEGDVVGKLDIAAIEAAVEARKDELPKALPGVAHETAGGTVQEITTESGIVLVQKV